MTKHTALICLSDMKSTILSFLTAHRCIWLLKVVCALLHTRLLLCDDATFCITGTVHNCVERLWCVLHSVLACAAAAHSQDHLARQIT